MKRKTLLFLALPVFLLISFKASQRGNQPVGVEITLEYFLKNTVAFTQSTEELYNAIQLLNTDTSSILKARKQLAASRLSFKRIEFFTEYFFHSETRMYNAAPVFEVEEPTLELVEPMGLQQIETLLYDPEVLVHKKILLLHADALRSSVKDLKSLLYQFEISDAQILESLRIELIRVMALSLTGYDAPSLKTGITESREVMKAVQLILRPYLKKDAGSKKLELLLDSAVGFLSVSQDFDSFDRMKYLTEIGLPLQKELGILTRHLDLELNSTTHLNHRADNIFSPDAFINIGLAPDTSKGLDLQKLGKMLFADKALSGKQVNSCASCHQPENYFNDNLSKSPSLHTDSILKRNTPTLLYAGRQHMQFWDGRAASLEDQIKNVIFNPLEMDGNAALLSDRIIQNQSYHLLFKTAFPDKNMNEMGVSEIAASIAAYVNSLDPMNSPFDRYIAGDKQALSPVQIDGFNLFMGKAQCGTCHFIPYFNSLLPPLYDISEVEILGTPENDDPDKPRNDNDPGRYDLFHIRYYKGAFKTPTVRNASKTAPYMHNGSFKTLNSLMEFYNRGGGVGLGLDIADQTLSPAPLNLTSTEIDHIISFIDSLTDSIAN